MRVNTVAVVVLELVSTMRVNNVAVVVFSSSRPYYNCLVVRSIQAFTSLREMNICWLNTDICSLQLLYLSSCFKYM